MRKELFAVGEFYHVYNRGTDKRKVFLDKYDFERFLQSMREFNTLEPIGSIYENSFIKDQLGSSASKSSWEEYVKKQKGICEKKIILDQFKSVAEYKAFAESSLKDILARKQLYKELETLLFE